MSGIVQQFPVEEEYKKPTGITAQDISKLREWLKTQPHLPGEHVTDLDLILTYHSCECSTEVSKQVLDLHYTLKTLFPRYFKDRRVDAKIEAALNYVLLQPLPTLTRNGYKALYAQMGKDPQNFHFVDALKAMIMVIELWQYEEGTWPGFVLICNIEGMVFGHMAKFDLVGFQEFLYYLQEALLVKLKGFYVINTGSVIDKVVAMARPFVKSEIMDLLHTYPVGSNEIDQVIPIEALPKEAGGNYFSLEELKIEVLSKMKANQHFFDADNMKRVSEALRPGAPRTMSDIFDSIEGTFKQLEVD